MLRRGRPGKLQLWSPSALWLLLFAILSPPLRVALRARAPGWERELGAATIPSGASFGATLAMASATDAPAAGLPPVIIVGGGLAGLSAAADTLALGGAVVVVEKMDRLGGNSAKASSGMNAAGSGPQAAAGIEDSQQLFDEDTHRSGKGLSTRELVEVVAQNGADAVRFLEGFGVNLSSIQQLGGHSRPRTHRNAADGKPMNIGFRIMSALIAHINSAQAKDPSQARVILNARVTELLTAEDGRVEGVRLQKTLQGGASTAEEEGRGSAVILATGGYSADRDGLLRDFAPCLRQLPTTNGPFATGDGVRLGRAVGAALVDMDQVQIHPTGLVDPKDPLSPVKILGPEILRGSGGVLLNKQGRRFVNELTTRDKVVEAMLANCSPLDHSAGAAEGAPEAGGAGGVAAACPVPSVVAVLVLTAEAVQKFGEMTAKFYQAKGLMKKFPSLDALAQDLGLPPSDVWGTIEAYDRAAAGQAQDPFGKSVFPCSFAGPLGPAEGEGAAVFAALVTPVLHYCMGGLAFDDQAHVLGAALRNGGRGSVIPGLYAAGEVTGGLHGANRLAGNSLLECVVFGRVAARSAFIEASAREEALGIKGWESFKSTLGGGRGKPAPTGGKEEL